MDHKKSFTKKLLLIFALSQSWLLGSCSGGSGVQVDLSGAQALLLGASGSDGSSLTSEIGALSADDAVSNLMKLLDDGTLAPVLNTDPTIIVTDIRVSPIGDVYIQFNRSVRIGGDQCINIVVLDDGSVNCVINELARIVYFDQAGNAYLAVRRGEVSDPVGFRFDLAMWDHAKHELDILLTLDKLSEIHFSFDFFQSEYRRLPDGSLILLGHLMGTEDRLFRYYPETSQLESLTSAIVAATPPEFVLDPETSINVGVIGHLDDGEVYIGGGRNIYKAHFENNGSLSLELLAGLLTETIANFYEFVRTSNGNTYFINYSTEKVFRIEPSPSEVDLPEAIDKIKIRDDFVYVSGTSFNGDFFFTRKNLVTEEETDLRQGRNLLVQNFDISSNGDIYFGALDLSDTTRSLYHYISASNELLQVASLPYDLADFVLLNSQ